MRGTFSVYDYVWEAAGRGLCRKADPHNHPPTAVGVTAGLQNGDARLDSIGVV